MARRKLGLDSIEHVPRTPHIRLWQRVVNGPYQSTAGQSADIARRAAKLASKRSAERCRISETEIGGDRCDRLCAVGIGKLIMHAPQAAALNVLGDAAIGLKQPVEIRPRYFYSFADHIRLECPCPKVPINESLNTKYARQRNVG